MKKKKVLVVATHPDDETLGCGGTLLRLKKEGAAIYWLILTAMSQEEGFSLKRIKNREQEIKKVVAAYGMKKCYALSFQTTRLDQYPVKELVQAVGKVVQSVKPDTLFIPHQGDIHTDHGVTFDVMKGFTKTFRYPYIKTVLMYETLSETNFAPPLAEAAFLPQVYVDITPHLERKVRIMHYYKGEIAQHPFPRSAESIRALAILRGTAIHKKYAESFMVLKDIQ